jgi:hypothetical protein
MTTTNGFHAPVSAPPPFANPETVSGLGLKYSLISDIFLKHALAAGNNTLGEIAGSMKIATVHAESVFHLLKAQQLIEVKGMYGEDYSFSLSVLRKQPPGIR